MGFHQWTFLKEYHAFYSVFELGIGSLANELKGKLSIAEKRKILVEIMDGLSYAHDNKIVHLDLKPENVIVVEEGKEKKYKLADWGSAKRNYDNETKTLVSSKLAMTYWPPEVEQEETNINLFKVISIYIFYIILYLYLDIN